MPPRRGPRCRRSRCSACGRSAWSTPALAVWWCRSRCRFPTWVEPLPQRRAGDPVGDGAQRRLGVAAAVRLEDRKLRVGRGAIADDGAAALDLLGAAERLGVGGGILDHTLEHL